MHCNQEYKFYENPTIIENDNRLCTFLVSTFKQITEGVQ